MSTISSLNTLVKSSVVSTDYLLVARTSPTGNNKFVLQDLFPSVNTVGTSSESLVINITDKLIQQTLIYLLVITLHLHF
jgi:hypothetical protein